MPRVMFNEETYYRNDQPKCPICHSNADIYRRKDGSDIFEGWCEVCRDVTITLAAVERAHKEGKAHILSRFLSTHLPKDGEREVVRVSLSSSRAITFCAFHRSRQLGKVSVVGVMACESEFRFRGEKPAPIKEHTAVRGNSHSERASFLDSV